MLTSPELLTGLLAALLQLFLGLLAENAGEWFFHRSVFHGLGKRPGSLWNYHWSEHHHVARANQMLDPGYKSLPLRWNTQGKEAAFLIMVVILHLPLLTLIPWYVCGLYVGLVLYYIRHRRSHIDPDWAASHLPWHYEHHMGRVAEANWCITWPWFDWIMGTRVRTDQIDIL